MILRNAGDSDGFATHLPHGSMIQPCCPQSEEVHFVCFTARATGRIDDAERFEAMLSGLREQ